MAEFRHLVRVANTDLKGNKPILFGLRRIKGVGTIFASAVCTVAKVNPAIKAGELNDAQIAKLGEVISNPQKFKIPTWLLNRRKDYETGEDKHLIMGDLKFQKENDLKRLKKIKSYRGYRHAFGLPTRGQKTRSNFRKKKGRGKGVIGVQKKKQQPAKKKK